MGYGTTETLSAEKNDEIGFSIGIAFAILNTVGFLLPATVLEPMSEKIGRVRTHTLCIALMAVGYVLLAYFGDSMTMLFIFMAIIGIGWGAVVSLPFAIMSEVVDQSRMGMMMGLFNLSVVIPQIVASNLGGFIGNQTDKNSIYLISAVMLGLSTIIWFFIKENKKPSLA